MTVPWNSARIVAWISRSVSCAHKKHPRSAMSRRQIGDHGRYQLQGYGKIVGLLT